jgi:hypothetical protein
MCRKKKAQSANLKAEKRGKAALPAALSFRYGFISSRNHFREKRFTQPAFPPMTAPSIIAPRQ